MAQDRIVEFECMIELVQARTGHRLRLVKALLTMYDRRTRYTQQVKEQIRAIFGERMYETVIGVIPTKAVKNYKETFAYLSGLPAK